MYVFDFCLLIVPFALPAVPTCLCFSLVLVCIIPLCLEEDCGLFFTWFILCPLFRPATVHRDRVSETSSPPASLWTPGFLV